MKPYIQPKVKTWFMRAHAYRLFMIRELTAVFILAYLVFLLFWLYRLSQGHASFEALVLKMKSPVIFALHLLVFVPAVYHSITWFNLTPKAVPIRLGEDRIPDILIAIGAGYLPWLVVSIFSIWVLLG